MLALIFPWQPFHSPTNTPALLLLYCLALTLVTALFLNGEAPPSDLTQKVPGMKLLLSVIFPWQALKRPTKTGLCSSSTNEPSHSAI